MSTSHQFLSDNGSQVQACTAAWKQQVLYYRLSLLLNLLVFSLAVCAFCPIQMWFIIDAQLLCTMLCSCPDHATQNTLILTLLIVLGWVTYILIKTGWSLVTCATPVITSHFSLKDPNCMPILWLQVRLKNLSLLPDSHFNLSYV